MGIDPYTNFLLLSILKTVVLINIFLETVILFSGFFEEKNIYLEIFGKSIHLYCHFWTFLRAIANEQKINLYKKI